MNIQELIKRTMTGIILGFLFWLCFIYAPPFISSLLLLLILGLIFIFEWKRLFKTSNTLNWLLMPLYPAAPFALLIYMNQHATYRPLLFFLFVIVFSFDTGSYIFGNLFGKHIIAKSISPRKSWEGVAGGYLFASIGMWAMLYEQNKTMPIITMLLFTAVVSILSLCGDLFESWLKRRAGIKDSSNLLPGHGGFLDRFDGILFAVFFFYFFRDYLMNLLRLL